MNPFRVNPWFSKLEMRNPRVAPTNFENLGAAVETFFSLTFARRRQRALGSLYFPSTLGPTPLAGAVQRE